MRHEGNKIHNNMHGFRGVEWENARGKYRARIEPANGHRGQWLGRFDTPEEAAIAYDAAARAVYKENAYLNFPREGEKKAVKSRLKEGYCAKGHDLEQHGRINVKGDKYCRECNRLAAARSYKNRTSKEAAEHIRQ